jgi:hypothetical protein
MGVAETSETDPEQVNRPLLTALLALSIGASIADVTKGEFGAKKDSQAPVESETKGQASQESKRKPYPFHGTLAAIDSSGKTLTLEGKKKPRVIAVTAQTRVFRNGAKAKLDEGTAGERVTGTVRRNSAGQEEAVTIRYAAKPPAGKP